MHLSFALTKILVFTEVKVKSQKVRNNFYVADKSSKRLHCFLKTHAFNVLEWSTE